VPALLKRVFQYSTLSGVSGRENVAAPPATSPRRDELLELAYRHALEHGLSGMSLRPLATAIGSSPRVLLFLFGSKDGLLRALLARARADELEMLAELPEDEACDLSGMAIEVWRWLVAPEHRDLLRLWTESYARSLVEPDGPWASFGRETVEDWLELLARSQSPRRRRGRAGQAERTLVLAILRGALLDLLATGDAGRTTSAVETGLERIDS
jgi:AcrR family transcriptional regulator